MTIENDFKVNKWNDSYDRGENNILYPQPEIVKFLNRFIKKKINLSGDYKNIMTNNNEKLNALDFGCGVARHAILLEEFGVEAYGVDISEIAIEKAKENAISFGFDGLANRLSKIEGKKLKFSDDFFDFSLAESSLDSMTFNNAKIFIKELARVTKKYIHLTLIASETSGDATFVKDTIVKNDHENGTVQSYYDINKIKLLLNEIQSNIIFHRKIIETSEIDNFLHARYHLVIKLD